MSRGPADEHCEQGTLGAEALVEDGLAERLGEIAVSKGADIGIGDLQVWRHTDFSDADQCAIQLRISGFAACDKITKSVSDKFTNA